ncbi:MAG: hypothetical protein R3E18_04320 [Sphingomonadaceae bacterium]|nr:hypothetical protein [Sphingomonadaceae bacterium]
MQPPPGFTLAFDLTRWPDFWFAGVWPLYLFPAILLLANLLEWRRALPEEPVMRWLIYGYRALLALLLAGVIVIAVVQFLERSRLRALLAQGEADFVAGCLDYYHPMPEAGHDRETVALGGRIFRHSDFRLHAAFNNTASNGGPIHADSEVRLWYSGSKILRAEVKPNACPAAPDPGEYGPHRDYLKQN